MPDKIIRQLKKEYFETSILEELDILVKKHSYIVGLDGIRAFALLAVMAYHLNFSWAGGGFLGVDIFFVISGYLISDKILAAYKSKGSFCIREFWVGRVRRLFPAVCIMIITAMVWTALFKRSSLTVFLGDAIASLFNVSNWWFIFHKLSYFDSFTSSPLKHLWSLAIEEQFYLIWPLILILGAKFLKKKKMLAGFIFLLALVSAVLMGILYIPGEDPSRVYYGTDTRAFELLIGSLLAVLYPVSRNSAERFCLKKIKILNIAGIVVLAILVFNIIFASRYNDFLYRGGMLLNGISAAILIICTACKKSWLDHIFTWKPLCWIGKRSYGIYLWHYPIIILSTPLYEIGHEKYWRIGLQLAAIIIAAQLSYHFIEKPIRKLGFKEFFKGHLYRNGIFTVLITLTAVVVTVAVVMSKNERLTDDRKTVLTETASSNETQSVESNDKILAIGDSIMLDIAESLTGKYDNIIIDANVGRQMSQAASLVSGYTEFNNSDKAVIIELGTNGYFTDYQINSILDAFPKSKIYLINVCVPREWESDVNKALQKKAEERNNVVLIDWYSASVNHSEYFASDGVHLQPAGIKALTSLIEQALSR